MKYTRAKTPTLLQMEAVECGAAALGIVLGYYKKFVPLEELRVDCGVSRNGSNAFNMKKAAERYGLKTRVFRKEFTDLPQIPGPYVILWQYNHFMVVEGFVRNKVYVNDPAKGPYSLPYEEFQKGYSGIILTFDVTDEFQKGGVRPSPFPGIIARIAHVKHSILFLLLGGFGLMLATALVPLCTKIFFDVILGLKLYSWGFWFITVFSGIIILVGCFAALQQFLLIRLNAKLSVQNSASYLWHILRLPLSFYQQRFGGEIAFRISLNDETVNDITGKLANVFLSCIFLFIYAFILIYFNLSIALIGIIAALLNFLCVILIQRKLHDATYFEKHSAGKFLGFSIGGIRQIESIKANGGEMGFFHRMSGFYSQSINTEQRITWLHAFLSPIFSFLSVATNAALFGIGGYLVIYESFTLGLFMAMQSLIGSFMQPVGSLVQLGDVLQNVQTNIVRLDDVLKNPIDPSFQIKATSEQPKVLEGYVEMNNVTFGYSPLDPPLISSFNLKLNPGQRVALVGPSGCGKTTIIRLLNGLLHPWSGEILIDGQNKKQLPAEMLSQLFATVDQQIFLFEGTIKDNLTLFDTTIQEEEMVRAAKDAIIHDEIMHKSKGYYFNLTEGGMNLSGGQRQRLEIARGLLLNPKILILDEATSALDSNSEEKIMTRIRRRGCSAIMVAHRLSTVRDCDEIIVLDKGKVVQKGIHDTLKNEPGLYQQLVRKESEA